jgi:hypothetical protein
MKIRGRWFAAGIAVKPHRYANLDRRGAGGRRCYRSRAKQRCHRPRAKQQHQCSAGRLLSGP